MYGSTYRRRSGHWKPVRLWSAAEVEGFVASWQRRGVPVEATSCAGKKIMRYKARIKKGKHRSGCGLLQFTIFLPLLLMFFHHRARSTARPPRRRSSRLRVRLHAVHRCSRLMSGPNPIQRRRLRFPL
jgi:hypothetical protein